MRQIRPATQAPLPSRWKLEIGCDIPKQMDIFSLFSRAPEKQIARQRKKVKEPHGDASVRMGAAERLYEMGTPESLRALLDRFTISVAPSTEDEDEKLQVYRWIAASGEVAIEPLMHFLRNEMQLHWPLKALMTILPEKEFAARITELLRFHWEHPPANPEPKAQIIRFVRSIHSPDLEEVVRNYLQDDDDDTCLAAVEYLLELEEEEQRDAILQTYADAEDRPRIRRQIIDLLTERDWSVKGFRPLFEETLPEGFVLTRDGKIQRLGR